MECSKNDIEELRNLFLDKLSKSGGDDVVSPVDLKRIKETDIWLTRFLEQNDLIMKDALDQLWSTCEWRKKKSINELSLDTVRVDYIKEGLFFPHNRDLNDKTILIFKAKLYTKGSKDMEELKRVLLYWVERLNRESNFDQITFVFDMSDTGMNNMDMEFTKFLIDNFKYYYPNSLNYIIVLEMPWILSAAFKIIKQLLPAKAVARLKFVNKKGIREYIAEDKLLLSMGGTDAYEFKFVEEKSTSENTSPNGGMKKENSSMMALQESPVSESMPSDFEERIKSDMALKIVPSNAVVFNKIDNEIIGSMEIFNIGEKTLTYKVKTTSPNKFRVRPSLGVIKPNSSNKIDIVLLPGQQVSSIARDKFLVMCMPFVDSEYSTDIHELWRNTSSNSPNIELCRLKCSPPNNTNEEISKNGTNTHTMSSNDRALGPTIAQLTETTMRLERQIKFHQTLQWITIFVFLFLAIAIVYILKIEIRNNAPYNMMTEDQKN